VLLKKKRLENQPDWLKQVPVSQLIKLGWLPKQEDRIAQLTEVLRFFGAASPEQWATVWREHQVAYRQTRRFEACAKSVSAWLRKGEIEARLGDMARFKVDEIENLDATMSRYPPDLPKSPVPDLRSRTNSCSILKSRSRWQK
jgi:HTH-type transcriptional regulator / antitoxin HigA